MKISRYLSVIIITINIIFAGSSCKNDKSRIHQVKFINGSSNNKLEVLDWGGKGNPIIFLAGLGNSAHIFDEFVPRFTDEFHVYALTRRGFGASMPAEKYDLNTLTADIIAIMDSLGLRKVIIAGHSIAGEEITKLAVLFPDRIDKIIYLDAAFDHIGVDSLFSDPPENPKTTKEDSASLQNIQKFYKTNYGFNPPDEEITQTGIFSRDGRFLKDVTADSIIGAVINGAEHPDYANIKCPALAIYAQANSVQQAFSFYAQLDPGNKKKADRIFGVGEKFRITQRNRFKNEVDKGVIKMINGANHYIFISHPDDTEKLMREFLK